MATGEEKEHVATAREEVLLYGLVDWVPLERVHWYVARANAGASLSTIQNETIETIRSLANDGLFEIGEVDSDSGFSAWAYPVDESIERIRAHYVVNFDDEDEWSFCCWLNLTEAGQRVADKLDHQRTTAPRPSSEQLRAEQDRLASAASLIGIIAEHVDGFVAVTGESIPEWISRLPLPHRWQITDVSGPTDVQPARVVGYRAQPDGGWEALETLRLFEFTGSPPAEVVFDNSDCTLRDLAAPLGAATAIFGPPATEVLDTAESTGLIAVRSSGQFVLSQRWVWAQYSTYIAPSEPPDQSLMLQQILHVDSTCREELEADIAELRDTVLQAFITER